MFYFTMKFLTLVLLLIAPLKVAEALLLEGRNATAVLASTTKSKVTLECDISGAKQDASLTKIWYMPDKKLLALNDIIAKDSMIDRVEVINIDKRDKMSLEISSVQLSDEGIYTCDLGDNTPESYSALIVNKIPDVSLNQYYEPVVENSVAVVATCFANLSKPLPEIWFVDSQNKRVENFAEVNNLPQKDGDPPSISLDLKKTFTQSDDGVTYTCMVEHEDLTLSVPTGPVNVHYHATAVFVNSELEDSLQELQEDENFEATCTGTGNPAPQIKWTFQPDVQVTSTPASDDYEASEKPPAAEPTDDLPSNFILTGSGNKIVSTSLKTTSDDVTNNGTFYCTASNGIGSPSVISFRLAVFDKPTTPPPPTTQAKDRGHGSAFADPTTTMGPTVDAAVIGGVVAVAVFVLIVTIIILLRYFMAHKGEYYTNELKANTDDVEEASLEDDDDDLPTTEAELLGEKKRREHFL
uniref:Cell adhesion molecule 2 n=1 Tax=Phallusia mammillata TaxID=59560 RepID=A0A6F9D7M7_9ASCI|nr:cell adhesion molecule 2 [Phallusia mammillata]